MPHTNTRDEPRLLSREAGLWAVAKPAGWLCHPVGDDTPDVVGWAQSQGVSTAKPSPCHRLDRDTSGILLLSSDPEVRGAVGQLFADGAVVKRYWALVHGRTRKKGIVRRALKDGRRGRPLASTTRYRRLDWLGRFTLVEARPEHGRKHQIRKHLAGIGHPVVGDARYGTRAEASGEGVGRLWLHALRLELPDGRTFEAPLPDELAGHLERLRTSER